MKVRTPLRAGRITSLLPGARFTRDVRIMGVVPSTSDLLVEQGRSGAGDGTIILAEEQTRGRGRRGNGWECPSGKGLLVSALIRPLPEPGHRPLLSVTVGIALCRSLAELGLQARLKWPNDVIVAGSKVAGILVDLCGDFGVLGIGINVNQHRGELPVHAPVPACSLAALLGRTVDRELLLVSLLRELDLALLTLAEGRTDDLVADFLARDALAGARVSVRSGDRLFEGVVVEAHPVLGILITTNSGAEERLAPEHAQVLRADLVS